MNRRRFVNSPTRALSGIGAALVLLRASISIADYFAGKPPLSDVLKMTGFVIIVTAATIAFIFGAAQLDYSGIRRVARLNPHAYVRAVSRLSTTSSMSRYVLCVDAESLTLLSFYRGRRYRSWYRDDVRSISVAPLQVGVGIGGRRITRPGVTIRFVQGGDPLRLAFPTHYGLAFSKDTAVASGVKRAISETEPRAES